ncbi:Saposin B domain-containing protein isoform 1 [Schistosoma japonicum]|uniref:Saposin B domain-containing protein isoform 1 n=2 Tax=Schistosoma japonicum TaxID=6182 RepID=A0A4Z2DDI2_SCHJA|nr:Saposin B domain-containing protein isoform 1 [Schistosoma japonicum]
MLVKIILVLFLYGLNNPVLGESIESYNNEVDELGFQIICETCVMNVRGIRWLLLQKYIRELLSQLFSVLCNFIPYKQPRAECKGFFHRSFDKLLHDFVVNMSVYEPCQYLGLCDTVQQEFMINVDESYYTKMVMRTVGIVKEDLKSMITPEYIQHTAKKFCSNNKMCIKSFKKYVNMLTRIVYKALEDEELSNDMKN